MGVAVIFWGRLTFWCCNRRQPSVPRNVDEMRAVKLIFAGIEQKNFIFPGFSNFGENFSECILRNNFTLFVPPTPPDIIPCIDDLFVFVDGRCARGGREITESEND
jgi:hypothetical protein